MILVQPNDPFARASKKMLTDKRISWKAKGILSYLSGQPDEWRVVINDIVNRGKEGRDAVYSAFKELVKHGYAKNVEIRDTRSGEIVTSVWLVRTCLDCEWPKEIDLANYPRPNGYPPDTGFPYRVKSRFNNNDRNDSSYEQSLLKNKKGEPANRRTRPPTFSLKDDTSFSAKAVRRFHTWATKNRLMVGKPKPNLKNWQSACCELLADLEGDKERFKTVLKWYMNHFKDDFVPQCYSLKTFCDNFMRVEAARKRWLKDNQIVEPMRGRRLPNGQMEYELPING